MSEASATLPQCPECGSPIVVSAPRGLCSRCLVSNALSPARPAAGKAFSLRPLIELEKQFNDLKIRRLVGQGGMGAVYEAWQESLARPVALKLLPPELLRSRDFFERFQREAQILARMDHPNVARVFDSGITPEGEAYILMDFIAGEPITQFLENAAPPFQLRDRLSLFILVCAGVQHAHQKGIIHRDLKPTNILVTVVDGRPSPKIIDFGLAKPADQTATDEALWLSANHAIGTPSYMSPEQAAGEEIDSRSDIYSLGLLMYEILAGKPLLTINEPPQPTPQTDPKTDLAINLEVSPGFCAVADKTGDLNAIVLKALETDPANRYQTVAALADDVQRHLTNQPVMAMKPAAGYLLRKFCLRHQTSLAVSAVLTILFLTGVVLIVRGSIVSHRAERLAGTRLRQGEKLIDFMMGDLYTRLEAVGRLDILEKAMNETESFYAQSGSEKQSPEGLRNQARLQLRLGRIRNSQGDSEAARKHYESSIQLYQAALQGQPGETLWQVELGQTWNTLAVFHHASGRFAFAEKAYGEALKITEALRRVDPEQPSWVDSHACLLHNMGALAEASGHLDAAEKRYSEALLLWESLLKSMPGNVEVLEHLSTLNQTLAFAHGRRGDMAQVDRDNNEALRIRQQLAAMDTNNMQAFDHLADIEQNISQVRFDRGNLAEARTWIERYLPKREQLAARDPTNNEWRYKLAEAWQNYALYFAKVGNLEEAAAAHKKAWEIFEKHLPESSEPANPGEVWLTGLKAAAPVFNQLARKETESGHVERAGEFLRVVVEIRAKIAGESPHDPVTLKDFATACLDAAATTTDRTRAVVYARLAVLALAKAEPVDPLNVATPAQWQLLQEFAGIAISAQNSATRLGEKAANLRAQGAISRWTEGAVRLPPSLVVELQK